MAPKKRRCTDGHSSPCTFGADYLLEGENKIPGLQEMLDYYASRETREFRERSALFKALTEELRTELFKGSQND